MKRSIVVGKLNFKSFKFERNMPSNILRINKKCLKMCLSNIWMPSKRKSRKMPKWWKTEEDPAILPRQWPRKPDKNRLWEKHCQIIQDLPPIFWNLPTGMGRWGANMRRGMRCWLWKYPHHFLVKAVDRDGPGLQPHPDPLKVNPCYNYITG